MVKLRKLAKITNSARSWSNLEIIHKSSCCVYATTKVYSYPSGSGVSMDFAPYTYQRKCLFQNVLVRKQSAGLCLYTNAHIWDMISLVLSTPRELQALHALSVSEAELSMLSVNEWWLVLYRPLHTAMSPSAFSSWNFQKYLQVPIRAKNSSEWA